MRENIYSVFVGKAEEIEEFDSFIRQKCHRQNVCKNVVHSSNGFSRLYVNDIVADFDFGDVKKKYPSFECLSVLLSEYKGCPQYFYIAADSMMPQADMVLDMYGDGLPVWASLFIDEIDKNASGVERPCVLLDTVDGSYSSYDVTEYIQEEICRRIEKGICITDLAQLCCPYKSGKKKNEFIEKFCNQFDRTDDILKITLTRREFSKNFDEKYSCILENSDSLFFIQSYITICSTIEYDLVRKTKTESVFYIINDCENPGSGKYDYKKKKIADKPIVTAIESIGIYSEKKSAIVFELKNRKVTCIGITSDMETVLIPEKEPTHNWDVSSIGSEFLLNCPSAKK